MTDTQRSMASGPAGRTPDAGHDTSELLPQPPAVRGRKRGNAGRQFAEWVVLVTAALLIAVLIKTFLFQPFYIPSGSMEPTLHVNDRIFVNKLSYRLHDVNRGDIVVFETPPGQDSTRVKDYVKRVIALPGEAVAGRNGAVWINGRRLDEPYVSSACSDALGGAPFDPKARAASDPLTGFDAQGRILPGYVFVMGDNRCNSTDSRVFGAIKESTIVGRAFLRIWPVSRLGLL